MCTEVEENAGARTVLMALFLPAEALPAAPHVLASLQPRGTHSATGRGGCAGEKKKKKSLVLAASIFTRR